MVIRKQTGYTLIELSVVLLVLVALAGVVIPYIGGTSSAALCNATDVTMQNVKKVIMERYYLDTLGYFPKNTRDKTITTDYNLNYLFTRPTEWASQFDLETQTGWRGAYLQNGVVLDGKYSDGNISNEELAVTLKTFTTGGDTVILDAWGRPIVIQVDTTTDVNNPIAKLVSAGSGSGLSIGDADIETPIHGGRQANSDDRILYLNTPTPAADINPSCNEN